MRVNSLKDLNMSDDVKALNADLKLVRDRDRGKLLIAAEESPLEKTFLFLWTEAGGPSLEREHKFHRTRKWRFDFAHLPSKTAIEIEGGIHEGKGRGRHLRAEGFEEDCIKYNSAILDGWCVIRLTSSNMADTIPSIIEFIRKAHDR